MPTLVTLRSGAWHLALAPEIGGAAARLSLGGIDLLRPMPAAALRAGDVRWASCFPLVPYSNRMADGVLRFAGEDFDLRAAADAHRQAIHGVGWLRPWTVTERASYRCAMVLDYERTASDAIAWPFRFQARQVFTLDGDGMGIDLSIRNTGDRPMPAGLGLHPYFLKTPSTRLRFSASRIWQNEDGIPQRLDAVTGFNDHGDSRHPGEPALDTMFEGWDGTAEIVDSSAGIALHLRAEGALERLMVFTPPGENFFALEPVSHATNGFNRPDAAEAGARLLEPGETMSGSMSLAAMLIDPRCANGGINASMAK